MDKINEELARSWAGPADPAADSSGRLFQWGCARSVSGEAAELLGWDPAARSLRCFNIQGPDPQVSSAVLEVAGHKLDFQPRELVLGPSLLAGFDSNNCAVFKLPRLATQNLPALECGPAGPGAHRGCRCRQVVRAARAAVLRVMFHPLSHNHLCVLCDGGQLEVYRFDFNGEPGKAVGLEPEQTLQVGRDTVSFCFAEPSGWGSVGIYLLAADGSVRSLCPVLPYHAPIPTSLLQQLADTLPSLPAEARASAVAWLETTGVLAPDGRFIGHHLSVRPGPEPPTTRAAQDSTQQFAVIRKPHTATAPAVVGRRARLIGVPQLQPIFQASEASAGLAPLIADGTTPAASNLLCLQTSCGSTNGAVPAQQLVAVTVGWRAVH